MRGLLKVYPRHFRKSVEVARNETGGLEKLNRRFAIWQKIN